jgi:hypothetical protein
MMIPHHQGAIDMAEAELLYGKESCDAEARGGDRRRSAVRDTGHATLAQ